MTASQDLLAEYSNMDSRRIYDWCIKQGISLRAINSCGGVMACNAHIDGELFIPDIRADKRLIVMPVYDGPIPSALNGVFLDDDEIFLADLVAWEYKAPSRLYFRRKEARLMLGIAEVIGHRLYQSSTDQAPALTVFATPFEWLKAGGAGVCPLDHLAKRELLGLHRVFCPDKGYAKALDTELRKPCPTIPQIMIPKEVRQHHVYA